MTYLVVFAWVAGFLYFHFFYFSMPRSFSYSCALCQKSHLKESNRRKLSHPELRRYVCSILKRDVNDNEVICLSCRTKFYRDKKSQLSPKYLILNEETDGDIEVTSTQKRPNFKSPKSIQLQISCTAKSHRRCIVCKAESTKRTHMVVVPEEAKTQAFIDAFILIHSNSRCCPQHLIGKYFRQDVLKDLSNQSVSSSTSFSRTDLTDLLDRTRQMIKSTGKLNFESPMSMSEDDYVNLTGLTREQFSAVCSVVASKIRSSDIRSPQTCLAVLLVKLRTGLSNSLLGTLFAMTKHQVQRCVHTARSAMMKHFVPLYLGFDHISHREFVSKHTTQIAKQIFADNDSNTGILVLDGTYLFIQKSSHHKFQKLTYNMHKSRCLVKPMMIVGTDGYIVNVLGPYFADSANNDASITRHVMKTNSDEINNWLEPNDVFIVDRGFRDVLEFLRSLGFQCEMPCYLQKGQSQHTVEEANSSRLITKIRWVVESANGRIKQWKFLDKVIPNHYVCYIGDFVRIVCSLVNCFRAPLISDLGYDELGKAMMDKCVQGNHVQMFVEENNLLKRRSMFSDMNEGLDDFPRMTLQSLRDITMGVYQLKQAKRYTAEHLTSEGEYAMMSCKDRPDLIRVKLASRHSSSKVYNVWVEYNPEEVTGWYCTCKIGTRVVGCCAHVASVLWYLSYSRWSDDELSTIASSSSFQSKMTDSILDARDIPDTESESESDDETPTPFEEE